MHFISVHKRNCNEPAMIHLQLRTNKKYEIQSAAEYGSLNSPSDLNRTGYLIHLECEKIQQATLSFFFSKVWEKLYSFLHLYTLRSKTWCCHHIFFFWKCTLWVYVCAFQMSWKHVKKLRLMTTHQNRKKTSFRLSKNMAACAMYHQQGDELKRIWKMSGTNLSILQTPKGEVCHVFYS